jgi:hypothetical protein
MNKARRHELKMLKYRKRLKNYKLKESDNAHAFRSHGSPCSCWACKDEKFSRKNHKIDLSEV